MDRRRLTQSERLAQKNARANRISRELAGTVGSPYRIHEAIRNGGKPIPNTRPETKYCTRCDALLTEADFEAEECTQCGLSTEPPTRIPCSYPGCDKLTTWDVTYGDLCYRHIRAENE